MGGFNRLIYLKTKFSEVLQICRSRWLVFKFEKDILGKMNLGRMFQLNELSLNVSRTKAAIFILYGNISFDLGKKKISS